MYFFLQAHSEKILRGAVLLTLVLIVSSSFPSSALALSDVEGAGHLEQTTDSNGNKQTITTTLAPGATDASSVAAKQALANDKAANSTPNNAAGTFDCGLGYVGLGGSNSSITGCFAVMMYNVMSLFAWLLGAVALLFSSAVYYTVIQLGGLVDGLTSITTAWGILRSIANIALLFSFILMGIATILDVEQYGVKHLLPKLLIAAIFLNFSLFITKTIIDAGDLFAVQFYKQLNGGVVQAPTFDVSNEPISTALMDATQLKTIYTGFVTGHPPKGNGLSPGTAIFICFLGIILFLIAAFTLLALTIMFVTRVIVLIFLMIVSPVGFIASAIPGLGDRGGQWWHMLANNVLFAPIVMLCLLISISILQHGLSTALHIDPASGASLLGFTGTGEVGSNPDDYKNWANLLLVFAISTGFLMASMMIAKQLSMMGANFAMSASKKIISTPFALGGAVAWRNTAAPLARWAGKKYDSGLGRSAAARWLLTRTGIDDAIKGTLGGAQKLKVGGMSSFEDRDKHLKEREKETIHAAETAELKDALTTGDNATARTIAQKMAPKELAEAIKTMSDAQVSKLGELEVLTAEKFEKMIDHEDVAEGKKQLMANGRFGSIPDAEIKDLTQKDQEQFAKLLGDRFERTLADQRGGADIYKEDQLEKLMGSDRLTPEQRRSAKATSQVGRFKSAFEVGNMAEMEAVARTMRSAQKARLDPEHAASSALVDSYNVGDLEALGTEKKLGARFSQIGADLQAAYNANPADPRLAAIANYMDKNKFAAGLWGWR